MVHAFACYKSPSKVAIWLMFSSQPIFKDYFTNENYRFPHLLTDAGKLHVIAYYLIIYMYAFLF